MKSDSKSVLKIKILFMIIALLFILGICLQIFDYKIINTAMTKNTYNEDLTYFQEQETAKIATAFTRSENVTSRSSITRTDSNTIIVNENSENTVLTADTDTAKNIDDSSNSVTENVTAEKQYKSIDEITISKDMDLTQTSGISKSDFKELLKNTKQDTTDFFYDNSDIIYDLCQEYEINEIFFCGLMAGESGWNIASNHRRTYNYISMMSNGSLIQYSSIEDGLESAAKLLHTRYLTAGGSCYCGKTLSAVQKRFCPNSSTWVNLIYTCMSQIVK